MEYLSKINEQINKKNSRKEAMIKTKIRLRNDEKLKKQKTIVMRNKNTIIFHVTNPNKQ